jgi:hypothetical protein
LVTAIREVATAGGIDLDGNLAFIGATMPDTAHLGDPGHVADHDALTAAVDLLRASDAYNAATGGTVTEHWDGSKMWRTHTFTADDTLTVTKDVGRPFEVFAVASGGQGGAGHIAGIGHSGYPGGGGGGFSKTFHKAIGSYPVKVGQPAGGNGQDSSVFGLVVGGGGGGGVTGKGGPNPGRPGSEGGTSNGGQGGGGDVGPTSPATALLTAQGLDTTIGAGGHGTGQDSGGAPGALGNAGIVSVSYEVAPWNSATGGTVNDVDDYNGTGEKWRVHTFTSSGTLDLAIAAQPCRVLVVGQGGNGGPVGSGRGGYGGGGGAVIDALETLTPGANVVTIGAPSSIGGATAAAGGPGSEGNTGPHAGGGGTSGNGNPGGRNDASTWCSGGGGGAGGPGHDAPGNGNGGAGGPGVSSDITGTAKTYGAGGHGGAQSPGNPGDPGVVIVAYRIG